MTKKIILCLMFLLLNSICLAGERWTTIYTDDGMIVKVDTFTFKKYEDKFKYVDCWTESTVEKYIFVEHIIIDVKTLDYLVKESVSYDKDGNLIDEKNKLNQGWKKAIPGTRMEVIHYNIIDYAFK